MKRPSREFFLLLNNRNRHRLCGFFLPAPAGAKRYCSNAGSIPQHGFYAFVTLGSLMFGKFISRAALALLAAALLANALLAPTLGHAASAQSRPESAVEREFLAARDAFERRDNVALALARTKFAAARKDFPLAPYIDWWWFSAQLAQSAQNVVALGSDIEKFLAAFPDTPFADQLRRDYLRALGTLNLWTAFAANQAGYRGDDSEVACQRLRYRLLGDDRAVVPAALADAKMLWAAAKPAAEPCYDFFARVADQLRSSGALTNKDVWRRTRTLFENGQINDARRSAAFATDVPAGFDASSAQANLDAKRFLDKHNIKGNERASVELALFAITRLARTNADSAAQWLNKNESRFGRADAQSAWAQIGYLGAMQLDVNAIAWFQRAGDVELNDTQAAWFARAALRETALDNTQWKNVRRAINAMSDAEKRESTWRYWLARALSVSGDAADAAAARVLRESLARENNFYGVLAAEELGKNQAPNFTGAIPAEDDVAKIAGLAGAKRAVLLYKLSAYKTDLRNDALREWQVLIRGMDDQSLLAAAEVASRNDLPDRAVNTAERTQSVHDFSRRYPLPHRDPLSASAKQNGLDEAWVFGLIRQESRFITDARSRVGAQGLMQLMPATAKWVAKQIGLKDLPMAKVVDVQTNLALGSYYLRHVLDDLGHPVLATAAYNAGPGRAKRWRADTPLEGAIYAESIPFNETRDYVKKVMVNKWFYGHRINGQSLTLGEIMGSIPPKMAASPTKVADTIPATGSANVAAAPISSTPIANQP